MSKKLWGGRFKKEIDKDFFEFQKSISYDHALAEYDVLHSLIHVNALSYADIITKAEAGKLTAALKNILKEIKQHTFQFDAQAEDIHTDIHNRIEARVGKLSQKLHTLRSRNDQIAFDEKWYCFVQGNAFISLLGSLGLCLIELGAKNEKAALVGYTHTQRAQIIGFPHYVNAYAQMFFDDMAKIDFFVNRLSCYIGSGALAGTAIPCSAYKKAINNMMKYYRNQYRIKQTVVCETVNNSLYNVSERDFCIEFLSVLSMVQMHLSRMSEDWILYSTQEFDFFDLPEEFCTGSSLMPHKKNPDFLELVRGSTGKVYGSLMALLTTMKALPFTYNRDMQLDKESLFSSVETIKKELVLMAKFVKGIKLKKENIAKALDDERLYATEIAEFLVTEKKVAFKEAHDIVGRLIRYCEDNKKEIKKMSDDLLKGFHPALTRRTLEVIMTPEYAVASKKSITQNRG